GVIAGGARGRTAFARRLMQPRGAAPATRTDTVALPREALAFPPKDLRASLAQQTALLAVAEEALAGAPALPPERTAVLVGMGCDATVARHGLGWKLGLVGADDTALAAWRAANADGAPALTAAGVLGTMPNLPANRLHAAKDWKGWGFTTASEELSGLDAL